MEWDKTKNQSDRPSGRQNAYYLTKQIQIFSATSKTWRFYQKMKLGHFRSDHITIIGMQGSHSLISFSKNVLICKIIIRDHLCFEIVYLGLPTTKRKALLLRPFKSKRFVELVIKLVPTVFLSHSIVIFLIF